MPAFSLPSDLKFNRGLVHDPAAYARDVGAASWLFLLGEEFAAMPEGISYEQVRSAVRESANVVSDPPRVLDLDLARQHVEALDALPRPTLVTCRTGPRAAAVAYMYAGVRQGADPEEVLAAAERDEAPFVPHEPYREWIRASITALRDELAGS